MNEKVQKSKEQPRQTRYETKRNLRPFGPRETRARARTRTLKFATVFY